MDSFYDAPRRPPAPPRFEKINLVKSLPVPEISIISNEKPPLNTIDTILKQNNEILPKNSPQSKRVHFHGSLTTNKPTPMIAEHYNNNNNNNKENRPFELTKRDFNLSGKTFKHIYMANIPNRDLDSSLLEPNIIQKPEIVADNTKRLDESIDFGRNFREFKTKFPITNTKTSYKELETTTTQEISKKVDKSISCLLETNNNLEHLPCNQQQEQPTIKDLLEIIKQQNQQIMSLQQQLFNLQNCLQHNNTTINQQQQQQQQSKKLSIDLKATSFEVSFRPQKLQKFQNHEPTIQEIIESSNDGGQDDLCLNLQQSIDIRDETCPSPTPSIRIDMEDIQDYKSDDSSECEEEIGVTLYENIMDQVNKMLENVRNNQRYGDRRTTTTVQDVKEATIRYLNDVGVTNTNDYRKLRYKPSEISFAVKQLLMKYLPDEQLVDFKLNQTKSPLKPRRLRRNDGVKNEFSIATLEYMKKYNLLGDNDRNSNNILDISTLKLQPKLL